MRYLDRLRLPGGFICRANRVIARVYLQASSYFQILNSKFENKFKHFPAHI
jgi:hypothetical protein